LPHRKVAVDAGTGDGALLEVLAPGFDRVVALDRSEVQLALAEERVRRRDLTNTELVCGEIDGPEVRKALARASGSRSASGACAVFAARVLHHAPVPAKAMWALVDLARPPRAAEPGGAVCVIDYEPHEDQAMSEQEADLWLGFDPADLRRFAEQAGLADISVRRLPNAWQGEGPDRHLVWQILTGRRGRTIASPKTARTK
jgi:ArsR family transcriptional regulator